MIGKDGTELHSSGSVTSRKKKFTDEEVLVKMGYTLGRELGAGTYAKVRYSEYVDKKNPNNKIQLACKIISLKDASKSFITKFFPRELNILCKLDHPNIIRVHSILKETEKFYMFMTFCVNGDLLEFIKQHGAIRESQARIWFSQLLEAMEYLHNMNTCHRDIKCENIMLSATYKIKVADFGFTREYDPLVDTLSETYCGSVLYAPPEVIRGTPYDPIKGDIWSLGVLLYTMINKSMPFDNSKGLTKLHEEQVGRAYKLRDKLKDTVSIEFKSFLYSILEPVPRKRPTVADLKRHPWIVKESATAAQEAYSDNSEKASRRNTFAPG